MKESREYRTILYERDQEEPHILHITLNRPEKLNAISIGPDEMTGELQDAIRRVDLDDDIKVAIFKGAGGNFSAGFDLSMVYRVYGGKPGVRPHQNVRLRVDEDQLLAVSRTVFYCKKVTIAQVEGWCLEAGMYIPECCDISIAASNSRFGHPGQRLAFGGIPLIGLELLAHPKKVTELLITGRKISAEEAERAGLITKAVPPEDLEGEVRNLAAAICCLPLDALVLGKLARRHVYEQAGLSCFLNGVVYHTLGTNLTYREDEKDTVFVRDREQGSPKEAFHKLHDRFEELINRTKYFHTYTD